MAFYIFFMYRTNMISAHRPSSAIMSTVSVLNNIPREETNPIHVQCRLACYSVTFHRRPPTLISQFSLMNVFHDFIVINLCGFFLFLLWARFSFRIVTCSAPAFNFDGWEVADVKEKKRERKKKPSNVF